MSFMYDYRFDCTSQSEACLWFAASAHSRNAGKNTPNIWAGIRGQTPMVSRAPQSVGFLKVLCGWVPYGLTQCYATLNPHHLPGGPGVESLPGLYLYPTPLQLCHSWVFTLSAILSLVPISRHTVWVSKYGEFNCSALIRLREEQKKFLLWRRELRCCGVVVLGICWSGGTQCTSQAGIYWKINHKSSLRSDTERFSRSTSPVWPVCLPPKGLLL